MMTSYESIMLSDTNATRIEVIAILAAGSNAT